MRRSLLALSVLLTAVHPAIALADQITLTGTVRDFKGTNEAGGHPDFEDGIASASGMVQSTLGADSNPVCNASGAACTSGARHGEDAFNQWYNDVPGVNLPASLSIVLDNGSGSPGGIYTFDDQTFFPIDGQLFGNTPGQSHNFHFTYEIHAVFTYNGGEVFTFTGDDDLWVFLNRTLAIDLGGVHSALTQTVNLDAAAAALGLTVGGTFAFDLFFAERHTSASTFRIDTSIQLEAPAPAVPLPSTLVLMVAGLAGVVATRRRRS